MKDNQHNSDTDLTVGERLAIAIEEGGYRKEWLADEVNRIYGKERGMVPRTITRYTKNKIKSIPRQKLEMLAAIMRVSIDWLLYGTGEMRVPGVKEVEPVLVAPTTGAEATVLSGLSLMAKTLAAYSGEQEFEITLRSADLVVRTTIKRHSPDR